MKALATVKETISADFVSFVRELDALSSRLHLRAHPLWSKHWEYPWINQRVAPHIRPGSRILDIGSELSPLPWCWAIQGANVWMVESNPTCIERWEQARHRLIDEGLLAGPDAIQWRIVRDEQLPFNDESFDIVSSVSVIEHMPNKNRAVAEAARVLKPDGVFAASFDICETSMGMTFPDWNGRALNMAGFDALIWNHPQFKPEDPTTGWNINDIAEFLAWHRTTAEHHNYVVGASILRKCCRWTDARSILVSRLDGLGDIVLSTGFLTSLRRRWPDARITIVVRQEFAAIAPMLPESVTIVALPFDPRLPVQGRENQIVNDLQKTASSVASELCILSEYNRVWAGEILASLCGAKWVVSFDGPGGLNTRHRRIQQMLGIHVDPDTWLRIPVEENLHETSKYERMSAVLTAGPPPAPRVRDSTGAVQRAAGLWKQLGLTDRETLLVFPSTGDRLEKSLDAPTWAAWMHHVTSSAGRAILLLGSDSDREPLEQIASAGLPEAARWTTVPLSDVELLSGLIKQAAAVIGADTGPTHIAAATGRPTLVVVGGGHSAERFNPMGRRVTVLRMPLGCYGCEWHCPFQERLCIRRIPPDRLNQAADRLLDPAIQQESGRPFVIDIQAPETLDPEILRAIMRQHRAWLDLNHQLNEVAIGHVYSVLTEMTEHNTRRDQAIAHLSETIAEMTRQNQRRDQELVRLNETQRRTVRLPARLARILSGLRPGHRAARPGPDEYAQAPDAGLTHGTLAGEAPTHQSPM